MVYRNCGMCHVEPLNRCSDCPGRRTVADTVREVAVPAAFDQRRVDRLNHRDFYEAYMGRPVPPSTLSTAKRLEKIWVEIHRFGRPSADNSFWMFEYVNKREAELADIEAAKQALSDNAEVMRTGERRHSSCDPHVCPSGCTGYFKEDDANMPASYTRPLEMGVEKLSKALLSNWRSVDVEHYTAICLHCRVEGGVGLYFEDEEPLIHEDTCIVKELLENQEDD